ncbi:MAG: sce7726 family protein [Bacteroidota bacterium]|jgi:hypothetical protein
MRDLDIRKSLVELLHVKYQYDSSTLIVEELGICGGESRIDVVAINDSIIGYEIKSEHDSLDRLPLQKEFYNKVCDQIYVVASEKHIGGIERIIPDWWGIIKASESPNGVLLSELRTATKNPLVKCEEVVKLIWKEEALYILQRYGLDRGLKSKSKSILWKSLVANLPQDELKMRVRERIKNRLVWRPVVKRAIGDESFPLLSM